MVVEVGPATVMPTTMIANWFEDTELPAPDGYFSIHDTLGHIKQSPDGAQIVASVLEALSTSRGEVGKRSEEHTSELQSRFDLVCRLLLEKKKQNRNTN